jgi:hypothetical protein
MSARRYPIRIGRRSATFLRVAFGVTQDRAWAAIEDGILVGRFGRFEVRVPVANITRWRIEARGADHGDRRPPQHPLRGRLVRRQPGGGGAAGLRDPIAGGS